MHGTYKLVKTRDLIRATARAGGLRDENWDCFIWGLGRPPEDRTFQVSPEGQEGVPQVMTGAGAGRAGESTLAVTSSSGHYAL